jgi:hypothetical protein
MIESEVILVFCICGSKLFGPVFSNQKESNMALPDALVATIQMQAQQIAVQNPTVDQLATFVNNSTSNPPVPFDAVLGAATSSNPWEKWAAQIKKAVCTDFGYCAQKAAVQADLNKYLPNLIQALYKNGVGHNGPSWLAGILGVLGFTAGWEAAIATVAAYFIIKGLDEWCACP